MDMFKCSSALKNLRLLMGFFAGLTYSAGSMGHWGKDNTTAGTKILHFYLQCVLVRCSVVLLALDPVKFLPPPEPGGRSGRCLEHDINFAGVVAFSKRHGCRNPRMPTKDR